MAAQHKPKDEQLIPACHGYCGMNAAVLRFFGGRGPCQDLI